MKPGVDKTDHGETVGALVVIGKQMSPAFIEID